MLFQLHDHQVDQFVNFSSVYREDVEEPGCPLPFVMERYTRRVDEWDALNQHVYRNL
jgi:hypothetical protein